MSNLCCPFCPSILNTKADNLYYHLDNYSPILNKIHFYSVALDINNIIEEELISCKQYELITNVNKNIFAFSVKRDGFTILYLVTGILNNQNVIDLYPTLIKRVEKIKIFE
jgi:hypothetical protein